MKETITFPIKSNEESASQLEEAFAEIQNEMRSALSLDDPKLRGYYEFSAKITALMQNMNHDIPEYGKVQEIDSILKKEFNDLAERLSKKDQN
ncbi:MAG: hypothetical protein V4665_01535 [Patescibacteria group bacterium]